MNEETYTKRLTDAIAMLYSGEAMEGDETEVRITGHVVWLAQQAMKEQAACQGILDSWDAAVLGEIIRELKYQQKEDLDYLADKASRVLGKYLGSVIGYKKASEIGKVVGVLAENEAGALAAVHDLGRVTWLDDCVAGPVARAQGEPSSGVPEGYALVPASIPLDFDDVENIVTITAWNEGKDDFGEGVLWVGEVQEDDGTRTHGLHISCVECMEEGALTIRKFDKPELTATPTPEAGQSGWVPVAWTKWFDGQQQFVEGAAFLPEDALSKGWKPLTYTHPHTNQPDSGAGNGWIKRIENECWDLRCTSEPTGGDDYDVLWHVIEHHMAEPHERTIGTGMTPTEALQRAVTPVTPCDWCGDEYPDDMLQNETEAGDAICDVCAAQPPQQGGAE